MVGNHKPSMCAAEGGSFKLSPARYSTFPIAGRLPLSFLQSSQALRDQQDDISPLLSARAFARVLVGIYADRWTLRGKGSSSLYGHESPATHVCLSQAVLVAFAAKYATSALLKGVTNSSDRDTKNPLDQLCFIHCDFKRFHLKGDMCA